jgi:hypothetical protein
MVIYPIYYKITTYSIIDGKSYDSETKQIVDTPQPPPTPPPTPTRTFDLPLGKISGKKGFGYRYEDMIIRGDGYCTFYNDYVVMSGAAPRLYIYDTNRTKKWKNLEVEVEYMRVSENNAPSYAGLGIGVRSIHETQTSSNLTVPTIYFKHTNDGRIFFEKEWRHENGGYTKQPDSQDKSFPNPKNVWQKIRFTVLDNELKGYQWINGAWKLVRQYKDTGDWDRHTPIADGTSCFLRNDSVKDFRIRKFSIKEIA